MLDLIMEKQVPNMPSDDYSRYYTDMCNQFGQLKSDIHEHIDTRVGEAMSAEQAHYDEGWRRHETY